MKIKVVSCEEKVKTDKFTIYVLKTEDGQHLDSFDKIEPGEHEGEIKENDNTDYNSRFTLKKKFGGGKDYNFEKKRVALECTVQLIACGAVEMKNLIESRDKFFNYLNS